MKTILRLLTVAAFLLGSASVSSANLITNGSFEDVPSPFTRGGGTWDLYASIPGWAAGVDLIEIGLGGVYGVSGFDGANVLELDANHNATVSQIVATPGGDYTLSFLFADRASVASSSASFQVYWNSDLVANISPTLTSMTLFSLQVTANANNTLTFKGTGTDDSYGAIIDKVELNSLKVNPNAVPDGGLTSALLGLSIVGLGVIRRIVV